MDDRYASGVRQAIERIRYRMRPGELFDAADCLRLIESNTGDPYACKDMIQMHAIAQAMLSWFEHSDLVGLKQWSSVAPKIRRLLYQERPGKECRTSVYLAPLLSDDAGVTGWYKEFEYPFQSGSGTLSAMRRDNPRMNEYCHYNTLLALRGEWDPLVRRCEDFLGEVPPRRRDYQADHRFHLALANGDAEDMARALDQIVDPKVMKRRQEEEGGTTEPFICTVAVVYAKIAWIHGHELRVSSPFVPDEWLPVAPLKRYDNVYAFVANSNDVIPVMG